MIAYCPTFDLPRTFDPTEFLLGRLMLQADAARWLVSTILRKTANRDIDLWGCVRLDSQILSRVMGNKASEIVRALAAGGAIETAPYRSGSRCKGYRLAARYLGDRCVRVPCVDPGMRERLRREHERMEAAAEEARARWLPIHHALDGEQRQLTIDPEADDRTRFRIALDAAMDHATMSRFMAGAGLSMEALDRLAETLGLELVARQPAKPKTTKKKGT